MKKYKAVVNRNDCVACGACIKVCPRDAITIEKGSFAKVDPSKCVGCKLCFKTCPGEIIDMIKEEDL